MSDRTLYLAWQDKKNARGWYPVGRLDTDSKARYQFCYIHGAEVAQKETGFEPLLDFPKLNQRYTSSTLFPLFQNRVLTSDRKDFADYLRLLDMEDNPDPIEILSVDGGYRATDNFEVFPKIKKNHKDGLFHCRFFLHGLSHVNTDAEKKLLQLRNNDKLIVTVELTNPATGLAIQIQTLDYHMLGWAPRYLVEPLISAINTAPGRCEAKLVQLNLMPAPSKQRALIELKAIWPDSDCFMNKGLFRPLC